MAVVLEVAAEQERRVGVALGSQDGQEQNAPALMNSSLVGGGGGGGREGRRGGAGARVPPWLVCYCCGDDGGVVEATAPYGRIK